MIRFNINKATQYFHYCCETGKLYRKKNTGVGGRFKAGSEVGTIHKCNRGKQYLRTCFDGSYIYVHRIAWAIKTGDYPECIDHIDGNGLNNRWNNLRSVDHAQNLRNQKLHSTNTSGFSGVTYRKDSNKWRARIMFNDKMIALGTFSEKEDAIQARKLAEKRYWCI